VGNPFLLGGPGGHHLHHITAPEVEFMLARDWRARREITQPAWDLVSRGFEFESLSPGFDGDAIVAAMEGDPTDPDPSSSPLRALGEMWAEGESYGGAVLVAIAADGVPPSEPIDLERLDEVIAWKTLSRWDITPFRHGGPGSPVDFWLITGDAALTDLTSADQIVHPSRVLVHPGQWMPARWMRRHNGWGLSRLEILRDQRATLRKGHRTMGRLLQRSSQDVLTLAEKSEMEEELGATVVGQKLRAMSNSLNSLDFLPIDGGFEGDGLTPNRRGSDKFQTMARPMKGASDISEAQHVDWRRGFGAPQVVADGEVNAGLGGNGAGASQWRAWAATIAAEQKRSLTHLLTFHSNSGPTGGRVPAEWKIEWLPIADPDHDLEAGIREKDARADKLYFDMGEIQRGEIRQHRHIDGKGGPIRVEDELPEEDPPPPVEPPVEPPVLEQLIEPIDTPAD
jgi:hypothetical protein